MRMNDLDYREDSEVLRGFIAYDDTASGKRPGCWSFTRAWDWESILLSEHEAQHPGGKFEQNQRFSIKIIHVCARLFTGFLPDSWWHRRPPQTANRPRPDGPAFRPSCRHRARSGLGKDRPFR